MKCKGLKSAIKYAVMVHFFKDVGYILYSSTWK